MKDKLQRCLPGCETQQMDNSYTERDRRDSSVRIVLVNLSLIPGTHVKEQGIGVCSCNPKAGKVETTKSQRLAGQQSSLLDEFQAVHPI